MALDLRLSRVRMGVAVMGQDCNYQLDIMKLWRKMGKKYLFFFFLKSAGYALCFTITFTANYVL